MENNTSGHGQFSNVPEDVKEWNWGAFWLTWVWGLGNRTYIALFAVIPFVNIFMMFYLGARGNELAWENNYWYNVYDLHQEQKRWAIGGWIVMISLVILTIVKGISLYDDNNKLEMVANESLAIIMLNSDAEVLIGEHYNISNVSKRDFELYETETITYTYILKSDNGVYWVTVTLAEDNIETINISPFEKNDIKQDDIIINCLK